MTDYSDTICAPATSAAGGAIAVVRISGPDSLPVTDRVVRFRKGDASGARGYTLKFGEIPGVDQVVAAIYRAPHSYTGEDSVELSCHASPYIVGRIISLLCEAGCRVAEAGEFTRRAFVNGKMDLAQAEAVADVIAASSESQHRVAMNQLRGGYSAELGKIRAQLLELSALVELELDFSEEEVEFADRSKLAGLLDDATRRCRSLADSFRLGNAIRNGVPVAIAGAPNSGKSTLLNALLKDDRAIVSDVPGTTRDTVEETCVLGGVLFRFIDTAGIRETSDKVEKLGIERTFNKTAEAEVVLGVVDMTCPKSEILDQVSQLAGMVDQDRQTLVILLNKCDLAGVSGVNKNVSDINKLVLSACDEGFKGKVLGISAKSGSGLEELLKVLVEAVGDLSPDRVLVTNARHAEALREAAEALEAARRGLTSLPTDLLAEDLRDAVAKLGSITGEITTDEVLSEIFGRFCIGK